MSKRVLFLCTGNYYRSRFAEVLFNHLATKLGLDWSADSRALAIELGSCNIGPISRHARRGLESRGVSLPEPLRFPLGCELTDLEAADLVVAVKEAEHRAYLRKKFPDWENRVTYWHVHDLDAAEPDEAMAALERLVEAVVEACRRPSDNEVLAKG